MKRDVAAEVIVKVLELAAVHLNEERPGEFQGTGTDSAGIVRRIRSRVAYDLINGHSLLIEIVGDDDVVIRFVRYCENPLGKKGSIPL